MRSRIMVAVVSCLVTAMVVGGFAVAAIPNGNTINACRNKTTFVLRVIDKDLGQTCTSSETALSWSSWRWRGPYGATTGYKVGDVVRLNGSSYLAKGPAAPPLGIAPTNTSYWALVAAKGDSGTPGDAAATIERIPLYPVGAGFPGGCVAWGFIGSCANDVSHPYIVQQAVPVNMADYPQGAQVGLRATGFVSFPASSQFCVRLYNLATEAPVAGSERCFAGGVPWTVHDSTTPVTLDSGNGRYVMQYQPGVVTPNDASLELELVVDW